MSAAADMGVVSLQMLAIGFTFGLSGPCLLVCGPVMALYFSGQQEGTRRTLIKLAIFLSGRVAAYVVLGALAGLSASHLRALTGPTVFQQVQAAGGAFIIFLVYRGVRVPGCAAPAAASSSRAVEGIGLASLFALGAVFGISPCPPLLALLSEVVLVARSPLQGALYTLAFGLGTFASGLLAIGAAGGLAARLPRWLFGAHAGRRVLYRKVCALIMVGVGFWLLMF